MNSIIQWCNDNQGVIAAIAILIVVVPAILGLIPKCIKYIQEKGKKKKDDAHNADLKAVVEYLNVHVVATPSVLATALNESEKDIQELLSELINQGTVIEGCNNCELSNPNSIWQLRR